MFEEMFGLLFPGQGAQRPGMGEPWQDHHSWVVVERLSEATGRDVAALLVDADAEALRQTRNSQLATFAMSLVALHAAWEAGLAGVPIGAVAGHSLGEYTALVAAGALDEAGGARLVVERGEAMQTAADARGGTMVAVLGLDGDLLAQACEGVEGAWTANDNAPGQIVLAGTSEAVAEAAEAAMALGAKRVIPLAVGGAFHSPLMSAAQERLDAVLAETVFSPAAPPVVTNVDARPHVDGFAKLLSAQLVAPVRWRQSLGTMVEMGVTTFVELGPGRELSGMVRRTVPGSSRAHVTIPHDLEALTALLAGD